MAVSDVCQNRLVQRPPEADQVTRRRDGHAPRRLPGRIRVSPPWSGEVTAIPHPPGIGSRRHRELHIANNRRRVAVLTGVDRLRGLDTG